jgi:flagellar hook-associated protein 2
MDVKALATSLVAAERAPQQALLDKKIASVKAEITGYGGMMFVLSELKKKVANLDDSTDFAGLTVKNTQPTAFEMTTSASALPGQHDVTINQIARAQRSLTASGFADNNSTVISGSDFTLNLTVGTASAVAITVRERCDQLSQCRFDRSGDRLRCGRCGRPLQDHGHRPTGCKQFVHHDLVHQWFGL